MAALSEQTGHKNPWKKAEEEIQPFIECKKPP